MAKDAQRARPRKARLGQNFLISPTAPGAIVEAMGDLSAACVLEIGPGHGVLTRLLAARSQRLLAVELDSTFAAALRAEFAGQPAVEILEEDILRVDLGQQLCPASSRWHIAGNLPYYITSEILLHLFRQSAVIESAVLMMQREVAERVVASPRSRDYGLLSATTQLHARAERLFDLPPGAFSPPPQVHSSVVRLTMQPRFVGLGVERAPFLRFLRQVFAQKRKTLANNLRAAGYDTGAIRAALAACSQISGGDEDPLLMRAEAASLETMACLFRALDEGGTTRVNWA